MDGPWLRQRTIDFVVGHAGLLPVKIAKRVRDFGFYALGAGSAFLPLEQSGEIRLLKRLAAEWTGTATMVDVGAHSGSWAQAVRSEFGPRAELWCFEPNPVTYELLERGIGGEPDVHCYRIALGEESGVARLFTNHPMSSIASLHPDTFEISGISFRESHEVSVETLDRIANSVGITKIDLLKIDVEGHELAVLRGARGLLDSGAIRAVQFEFGERDLASRTYLRDILDLLPGYQTFRIMPRGLGEFRYRPADEVFLLEANYLAIRQPDK